MEILSVLLRALSGIVALLFGRRFFWLFLAIVGFIAGFALGTTFFPQAGALVHVLVGLGIGILGALLSQAAPVVIAAIVGFFAGGAALVALVNTIVQPGQLVSAIIFVLAGAIGAYLVTRALDTAIVVLSSLSGASALSTLGGELIAMNGTVQFIAFLILFVIGVLFQLNVLQPYNHEG